MCLIHLHNELVCNRILAAESWSTYISYSLDDFTKALVAETIAIYHNGLRPYQSHRRRIGQQRVSYNKAPLAVIDKLWLFKDVMPAQPRDTTSR